VLNIHDVSRSAGDRRLESIIHALECIVDVVVERYVMLFDVVREKVAENSFFRDVRSTVLFNNVADFPRIEVLFERSEQRFLMCGYVCFVNVRRSRVVVVVSNVFEI